MPINGPAGPTGSVSRHEMTLAAAERSDVLSLGPDEGVFPDHGAH
jgi:hypothetical protein